MIGRLGGALSHLPGVSRLKSDDLVTAGKVLKQSFTDGGVISREMAVLGKNDAQAAGHALQKQKESLQKRIDSAMDRGADEKFVSGLEKQRSEAENLLTNHFDIDKTEDGAKYAFKKTQEKRREDVSNMRSKLKDNDRLAMDKAWDATKEYYRGDGDMKTIAARAGATGAAYMGANAGLRYMSGGGVTYNNQGQRDIAGIPFL